ncbi:MAG TPA: glycosyltransferase [Stellaceae bacterium]|nr:glycosyltransferase [Stellaceae bacterium]
MTLTLARAATTPRAPRPAQPSARHLVHVLPGFGVGGIQIRLARLINALGGRFRHTILTINGQDGCRDRLDPALGVAIEAAPVKGGLFSRVDADAQRLASLRPDLLLTYNWGAIEWAMANRLLAHRRHIHAEDGFGPEEAERQLRRRIMLRRWALRRAETLIVPSRTLESIAIAQWRLPPERVRYVPNSIDADDFAATAAGAPLFARAADEIVIGTVAPLRPEKNLARLIRAFARIPAGAPLRLVLAGDGPERPALEALARSQNLSKRVLFLGPVREPQRALALFDIFALSSDTEQMPMTVLEAMAMGLPIASVDVGDVKLMVAPGNRAFVTSRGDEAALASALAALALDETRRRDLGRLNRAQVRMNFPWQRMVDTYARLYETGLRQERV